METAFVLVNIDAGRLDQVVEGLRSIGEVTEIYSVTGDYDLFVKVRFPHFRILAKLIPERIQKVDGITRTTTVLAFEAHKYSRYEPCDEAKKLEEEGERVGVYELCQKCTSLKECIYGQKVLDRGIEPTTTM